MGKLLNAITLENNLAIFNCKVEDAHIFLSEIPLLHIYTRETQTHIGKESFKRCSLEHCNSETLETI